MPRFVRNWWIKAEADGMAKTVELGPRSSAGGIDVTIKQRDRGDIMIALQIRGFVGDDGRLVLQVFGPDDKLAEIITSP